MGRNRATLAIAALAAVLTAACSDATGPAAARSLSPAGPSLAKAAKVTICHAAGRAGTEKYIAITTSENGLKGHFDNDGTPKAGHELDFIATEDRPCNAVAAAQVQVCTVHFLRPAASGKSMEFRPSYGSNFNLDFNQCGDIEDVFPGEVEVYQTADTKCGYGSQGIYVVKIRTEPAEMILASTPDFNGPDIFPRPADCPRPDGWVKAQALSGQLTKMVFYVND